MFLVDLAVMQFARFLLLLISDKGNTLYAYMGVCSTLVSVIRVSLSKSQLVYNRTSFMARCCLSRYDSREILHRHRLQLGDGLCLPEFHRCFLSILWFHYLKWRERAR